MQSTARRCRRPCALQVAVLVPAALGRFSLWGAVFVDVGSSLLVVANALRWVSCPSAQLAKRAQRE